jgi:membrane dipeptidase
VVKAQSTSAGSFLVWDNHACMPLRPDDESFLPQLEQVRESGVHVLSLNASFGETRPEDTEAMLSAFHRWIGEHGDTLMLVKSAVDADAAKAAGKLGLCFDIESMSALGGDVARVERFYELGVRWMLATYNHANAAGGGCIGEDEGLTDFGRSVIDEMNRVGMVVCATHCGYRTAREMISYSQTPVIFSHSNPRARCDNPRNIPDDLIRACAERGGVVGLTGYTPFLGASDAPLLTFVEHVEHIIDLVGDDHVGIALDYVFDEEEMRGYFQAHPHLFPLSAYPQDGAFIPPWRIGGIAALLVQRRHCESTLRKVLGGNHQRIASQVWR